MELMGPKPLTEIEAAQKRILQLVRGMEERGEITVSRGGSEQLF
jgi:flagellar motor switch protein FliG